MDRVASDLAALHLFLKVRRCDDLGMAAKETRWRAGDPLEAAEELMLECAAKGELLDGIDEPSRPDGAAIDVGTQSRMIRAAVLRHLLTENDWAVDPKGVRLSGVRVTGLLDLEAAAVRCPLWMDSCHLEDPRPIALNFATIPLLVLRRCRLAGLSGDTLAIAANLNINNSVFTGSVVLSGARVGGALLCFGTQVGADEYGNSLSGHGMNVRLSVHLTDGFAAAGAVRLPRVDIGGELFCGDSHFGVNEVGVSLAAQGLRVTGAAYFDREFSAQGAVRLTGANIGGQLRCDGARVGADPEGNSLVCDGMRVGGSLNLSDGVATAFMADGAVRLAGAEIAGSLSCRGARLGSDRDGNALVADEMKVRVAVLLDRGFTAAGTLRLAGADIGGQLHCQGSEINGADSSGDSLAGDGIKVGGAAYLDRGFRAVGAVRLSGADFGGPVSLVDARLGANEERNSLVADGMRTSRDVLVDDGNFDGGMFLSGAVIDGSFAARGIRLGAGRERNALVAVGLKVGRDLLLDRLDSTGSVIVAGADIGGRFCCRGAVIGGNDGDGDALIAAGAKVVGSVLLGEKCIIAGAVQLSHASIGGSLHCGGARLGANKEQDALVAEQINVVGGVLLDKGFAAAGAVSLRGASITRELRWEPGEVTGGEVNLEGASAHRLADNWTTPRTLGYWPSGRLRLAGFTYDGFSGEHAVTVNQRLDWLRSQYDTSLKNTHVGNHGVAGTSPPALVTTSLPFTTQPYKHLLTFIVGRDKTTTPVPLKSPCAETCAAMATCHGPLSPSTGFWT